MKYLSKMITGSKKYAELRGLSDRSIRKAIVAGRSIPGVTGHQKVGKTFILTVDIKSLAKHVGMTEKKVCNFLGGSDKGT